MSDECENVKEVICLWLGVWYWNLIRFISLLQCVFISFIFTTSLLQGEYWSRIWSFFFLLFLIRKYSSKNFVGFHHTTNFAVLSSCRLHVGSRVVTIYKVRTYRILYNMHYYSEFPIILQEISFYKNYISNSDHWHWF